MTLNSVSDDLNRVLLGGLNFKLCSTDGLNLVPGRLESRTARLVNFKFDLCLNRVLSEWFKFQSCNVW